MCPLRAKCFGAQVAVQIPRERATTVGHSLLLGDPVRGIGHAVHTAASFARRAIETLERTVRERKRASMSARLLRPYSASPCASCRRQMRRRPKRLRSWRRRLVELSFAGLLHRYSNPREGQWRVRHPWPRDRPIARTRQALAKKRPAGDSRQASSVLRRRAARRARRDGKVARARAVRVRTRRLRRPQTRPASLTAQWVSSRSRGTR